jgi:hypothetical protein
MKSKGFVRFINMTFLYDQEPFEFFSIMVKFIMGLWFLLPIPGMIEANPGFEKMTYIAPAWLWGIFLIGTSLIHARSVFNKNWHIRKHSIYIACLFWMFLSGIYIFNFILSALTVVVPLITLFTIWVYLKVSQRERIATRVEESRNE